MKKNLVFIGLALVMVILFSGCADVSTVCPAETDTLYGFWYGLWHGIVAGFAFIGSLFSDDIAVYAVNNTGGWYDFGFLLGIGAFTGGSSSARR